MINKLENLPNEILLNILLKLNLLETIESFWSINKRFNQLVCLKISIDNGEISICKRSFFLFYKYKSILSAADEDSSLLINNIKSIYIDGRYSNCCDIVSQWIFNGKFIRLINLKKLVLTEIYPTETFIDNLLLLITNQLDRLKLSFDKDVFKSLHYEQMARMIRMNQDSKIILKIKDFLYRLLSTNCNLTSLKLDISNDTTSANIHYCFLFTSHPIDKQSAGYYSNLRYLNIHLIYGHIIEYIILYTPVLEVLKVRFEAALIKKSDYDYKLEEYPLTTFSWCEKIPKLKFFSVKSNIFQDLELQYLKWILNNVDYIEKLNLYLNITTFIGSKCFIDGINFHEYFLPDISDNLNDFDFYIALKSKELLSFDIETIVNSFKTNQFFVNHHWINVQCVYDPNMSYQHLSSTKIRKRKFHPAIMDFPSLFDWKCDRVINIDLNPSTYNCLQQINTKFPHINSIIFDIGQHNRRLAEDYATFLEVYVNVEDYKWSDIHLQFVTRLDLGICFARCGVRPHCQEGYKGAMMLRKWSQSLKTPESIEQHVHLFEQDLCQLVENLKDLAYLDICGKIYPEKIEPYRAMIQRCFPNSRFSIEISRFRLWL